MKTKFKLSNLVLYAKGWYLITDNIEQDLIKILELDDYTCFNLQDVYSVILHATTDYSSRWVELREVLNAVNPKNCWKCGYNPVEYKIEEAFIYYTLSSLRFIENTEWDVITPKVTKYPRGKQITIKKLVEQFN